MSALAVAAIAVGLATGAHLLTREDKPSAHDDCGCHPGWHDLGVHAPGHTSKQVMSRSETRH